MFNNPISFKHKINAAKEDKVNRDVIKKLAATKAEVDDIIETFYNTELSFLFGDSF